MPFHVRWTRTKMVAVAGFVLPLHVVLAQIPVFSDDFESGDDRRWTSSTP